MLRSNQQTNDKNNYPTQNNSNAQNNNNNIKPNRLSVTKSQDNLSKYYSQSNIDSSQTD